MMKVYTIDNQLKVGATEKPNMPMTYVPSVNYNPDIDTIDFYHEAVEYEKVIKDWEESLMDVENETKGISKDPNGYPAITWMHPQLGGHAIFFPEINHFGHIILSGQQVEITKTDKGCRITKIL